MMLAGTDKTPGGGTVDSDYLHTRASLVNTVLRTNVTINNESKE